MNNNKLSAVRIVFGVFFSILFLPIMFTMSVAAGHIWTVDNDILNKGAILEEFDEINGYDKLLDIALESVSIGIEDAQLQKKIVSEVFDEECIDEVFVQIMDRLFEGKEIDIDLEDKLEKSISNAIINIYNDEAENVIDAWISRDLAENYEMIYNVCGEEIDEQMVIFAANKLGVDKSAISVDNVREYLNAYPISEDEKKTVIKECGKIVDAYVDSYAGDIAKEVNSSIEEVLVEVEDSEEFNEASKIIVMIKSNATIAIIICVVVFAVCWLILLLIFKARRAGFAVPAVSLILSAIVYFAEYILVLWASGELSDYALEFENSIEVFVFEFMMRFVENVKNTILMCGAVTFVIAVVLIIVGCILHMLRKRSSRSMQ